VPISAKLVARLIEASGASRVLTMDLHSAQIQGFFDVQADHLFASPVMLEFLKESGIGDLTMVAPDVGSVKMSRALAKRLNADLAVVDKRRSGVDKTEVMNIIGEVEGRNVVIYDDMISSGSTLVEAAAEIQKRGARSIIACATHPVFSTDACTRVMKSPIREVAVTNSIPFDVERCSKVKVLDVSKIFGEAIRRIHRSESVSILFPD
jgi:ribose-phosphate pyrophosphokinase